MILIIFVAIFIHIFYRRFLTKTVYFALFLIKNKLNYVFFDTVN